ncbi:MAG: NTP transferase domain-containing protein [Armatimonadetes bacterium]|nr:NTP transferase domain-containing protein [Armatimonadota bacterium]
MNLIVLAAGLGTRFGGPKQFFPVGPGGECLFHFSLRHGLDHGVESLTLVTRSEIVEQAKNSVQGLPVPVRIAIQETLGGKPRGTADALLCALRQSPRGQFAIINGDDYYGEKTFRVAKELITGDPVAAAVPYLLGQTLSPHGGVSRAVCTIESGFLTSIRETHGLEAHAGGAQGVCNGQPVQVGLDCPVSMNFFTFSSTVAEDLAQFVDQAPTGQEVTIPDFLNDRISRAGWKVPARLSASEWFGMTFAQDLPSVQQRLAEFCRSGKIPHPLW